MSRTFLTSLQFRQFRAHDTQVFFNSCYAPSQLGNGLDPFAEATDRLTHRGVIDSAGQLPKLAN